MKSNRHCKAHAQTDVPHPRGADAFWIISVNSPLGGLRLPFSWDHAALCFAECLIRMILSRHQTCLVSFDVDCKYNSLLCHVYLWNGTLNCLPLTPNLPRIDLLYNIMLTANSKFLKRVDTLLCFFTRVRKHYSTVTLWWRFTVSLRTSEVHFWFPVLLPPVKYFSWPDLPVPNQ